MTTYYMNNHLLQLRNIFLDENDFPSGYLFLGKDDKLTTDLQKEIKAKFTQLKTKNALKEDKEEFWNDVSEAFTRTEDGNTIEVKPEHLITYLGKCFFMNHVRISRDIAEKILSFS